MLGVSTARDWLGKRGLRYARPVLDRRARDRSQSRSSRSRAMSARVPPGKARSNGGRSNRQLSRSSCDSRASRMPLRPQRRRLRSRRPCSSRSVARQTCPQSSRLTKEPPAGCSEVVSSNEDASDEVAQVATRPPYGADREPMRGTPGPSASEFAGHVRRGSYSLNSASMPEMRASSSNVAIMLPPDPSPRIVLPVSATSSE